MDKDIVKYLKIMAGKLCCQVSANTTSAGVNTSVTDRFKSISISKTNNIGTVNITMSDGSVYPMIDLGEIFYDAASPGSFLPAYTISSSDGGTWKWHSIK